ncbi:MAG: acylphosphatase [Gemmatimonadota bacterium]|jgi:acylphosphatase|nr:acylphosphatase [Gemmatimonadota bacterium]
MPQRAYRVRGGVQGVGFRWWTRSQAQALGINGSVRNCADGSVEVQMSGEAGSLQTLVDLLRHGPPGAHVASVEPIEPDSTGITGFRIER